MAIRSKKNLYPGINPHLNSALQQPNGGWQGFHATHINDIANVLESLLEETKYYLDTEKSLQVKEKPSRPDILIMKRMEGKGLAPTQSSIAPMLTLPMMETLGFDEDEDVPLGVVIYSEETRAPVTRIEVLSPTNKPPSKDFDDYVLIRRQTLEDGLRLIEVDYIHQRHPLFPHIPSYKYEEPGASPYHIIVSDPRPNIEGGQIFVYCFGLMDELPKISIPLSGDDKVLLDFGIAYTHTFESRKLYWEMLADYSQLPAHFASYTPDDQEKIRARMTQIAQDNLSEQQNGDSIKKELVSRHQPAFEQCVAAAKRRLERFPHNTHHPLTGSN